MRCITGSGGSGKTRFALELVHHLRTLDGWDGRFVRFEKSEPFDLWGKTSGSNHVLLVFDYAPDNAGTIAASLRASNIPSQPCKPAANRTVKKLHRCSAHSPECLETPAPSPYSGWAQQGRK